MPEGVHPFPYRTRQLSPPGPTILPGQPGGKIGRRQDYIYQSHPSKGWLWFCTPPGKFTSIYTIWPGCIPSLRLFLSRKHESKKTRKKWEIRSSLTYPTARTTTGVCPITYSVFELSPFRVFVMRKPSGLLTINLGCTPILPNS